MATRFSALLVAVAILIVATALLSGAYGQERETYTWLDDAGQRHYSDRPPPEDARAVRTLSVPASSRRPAPPRPSPSSTPASPSAAGDEDAEEAPLTISVLRPQADETFVNTAGQVQAAVSVSPRLPNQGRVSVYLDGALATTGQPGQTSFVLSSVYRGTHTLSAVVLDNAGRQLARSPNITFYVRQASALRAP